MITVHPPPVYAGVKQIIIDGKLGILEAFCPFGVVKGLRYLESLVFLSWEGTRLGLGIGDICRMV